jgi:hypothetical protein
MLGKREREICSGKNNGSPEFKEGQVLIQNKIFLQGEYLSGKLASQGVMSIPSLKMFE